GTCHRSRPVSASSAMKLPWPSPENTSPPAVENTPAHAPENWRNSHLVVPVNGSTARTAASSCSSGCVKNALPMYGRPGRCGGSSFSSARKESHVSLLKKYMSFVFGLYDGWRQFVPPAPFGLTRVPSRVGSVLGSPIGLPWA